MHVFERCSSLVDVELSGELTSLPQYTFMECSALKTIKIPDKVTTLGNYCFKLCQSLKTIEMSPVLTSLGSECFGRDVNLEAITFPETLTSIGSYCFEQCSALKTIISFPKKAPSVNTQTFGGNTDTYVGRDTYNLGTNKLYVPANATGYEQSLWATPLLDAEKCGFTISYTL